MIESLKWYCETWWKAMMRPIIFYQKMPDEKWSAGPLNFALATGWIISFFITLAIFVIMYIPTGMSLINGIKGRELVIVAPVLMLMGVVWFVMTILIVAAFVIAALLALLFAATGTLNLLLILLDGEGNFYEMLKAILYSSSAFLVGLFTILFMILVKWKVLSFNDWLVGENALFYTTAVYIYGLWSIAGRRVHSVPRWKAFLAALFPLIILIICNVVFAAKVLPKMEGWIS